MDTINEYSTLGRALSVLTTRGPWRVVLWQLMFGCLLMSISCSSVWTGTHDGVRFTVHQDKRWSRIEHNQGPFSYDSPELTVAAENGRLVINNEDAGELSPGDHVEITDLGTVLVNGQRRGDAFTGKRALEERLAKRQEMLGVVPASGTEIQAPEKSAEGPAEPTAQAERPAWVQSNEQNASASENGPTRLPD